MKLLIKKKIVAVDLNYYDSFAFRSVYRVVPHVEREVLILRMVLEKYNECIISAHHFFVDFKVVTESS